MLYKLIEIYKRDNMKTIFKVGMKVYDQLNFPNKEGKITKIEDDGSEYPIAVCFSKDSYRCYYDLNGCIIKGKQPTLSTKQYTVELKGFEQKPSVPTYEEILLEKGCCVSITKTLILPDEKLVNAFEALAKLIWLRDYYNEGWQPNWKDKDEKRFFIEVWDIGFFEEDSYRRQRPLIFKTRSIAKKFIEEQKELLKIAKPLL